MRGKLDELLTGDKLSREEVQRLRNVLRRIEATSVPARAVQGVSTNETADLKRQINDLKAQVAALQKLPHWVDLPDAPLTSTSWDGDAFSTTGKTLLDLSAVFGVPAHVKAIRARVIVSDAASAATNGLFFGLDAGSGANLAIAVRPSGLPNGWFREEQVVIPCNSAGDVYYQVGASGVGTMIVYIFIIGYEI